MAVDRTMKATDIRLDRTGEHSPEEGDAAMTTGVRAEVGVLHYGRRRGRWRDGRERLEGMGGGRHGDLDGRDGGEAEVVAVRRAIMMVRVRGAWRGKVEARSWLAGICAAISVQCVWVTLRMTRVRGGVEGGWEVVIGGAWVGEGGRGCSKRRGGRLSGLVSSPTSPTPSNGGGD